MKNNLMNLKNSINQNLDLINDFQELIELEEKSVAQGSTDPIDITYLKRFNAIQLFALETCQKLLEKHKSTLEELAKAKTNQTNKAVTCNDRKNGTAGSNKSTVNNQKNEKEAVESIDLFAMFDGETSEATDADSDAVE